ncbi:unnamed protein product [Mycena citricolor]|uniref:Secreted protein n=1 Tax=Mycena citricolor TaxID=2018698 RepID=A0AAD2HZU9_9AGAR|nr:unnamed protein product [Mycena citricolor]
MWLLRSNPGTWLVSLARNCSFSTCLCLLSPCYQCWLTPKFLSVCNHATWTGLKHRSGHIKPRTEDVPEDSGLRAYALTCELRPKSSIYGNVSCVPGGIQIHREERRLLLVVRPPCTFAEQVRVESMRRAASSPPGTIKSNIGRRFDLGPAQDVPWQSGRRYRGILPGRTDGRTATGCESGSLSDDGSGRGFGQLRGLQLCSFIS